MSGDCTLPLLLASTSRWRRDLLARLGAPFEAVAPGVEEDVRPGEAPEQRARRLAGEKARAVARTHPEAVVIGSDQVASCGGALLHKPGNPAACRRQLAELSGRRALFHTGCVVLVPGLAPAEHVDVTQVLFRALDEREIARYVELDQPWDCAGGFRCESLGIALFERIENTDPTALVGLPLIWLSTALRRAGYRIP